MLRPHHGIQTLIHYCKWGDMFDVPDLRDRLVQRITEDRRGIVPAVIAHDVEVVMEVLEVWLLQSYVREENVNAKEYIMLTDLISFSYFDYGEYIRDEKAILTPQLEHLGYTDIIWGSGEADSFGPLTRICRAKDKFGNAQYFMYG